MLVCLTFCGMRWLIFFSYIFFSTYKDLMLVCVYVKYGYMSEKKTTCGMRIRKLGGGGRKGVVVNFFSQFLLYKFVCVCSKIWGIFAHFNGDEVYNLCVLYIFMWSISFSSYIYNTFVHMCSLDVYRHMYDNDYERKKKEGVCILFYVDEAFSVPTSFLNKICVSWLKKRANKWLKRRSDKLLPFSMPLSLLYWSLLILMSKR